MGVTEVLRSEEKVVEHWRGLAKMEVVVVEEREELWQRIAQESLAQ